MSDASKPTPSRVRIDVQVREVKEDGIPDDDLRYVTFSDEVNLADIRDLFDRSGIAVNMLFNGNRGAKFVCLQSTPANKIWMIKKVRELTGCGLKEAKDLVEAPLLTPIAYFEDGRDADDAGRCMNEDQPFPCAHVRATNVKDMAASNVLRGTWRRKA